VNAGAIDRFLGGRIALRQPARGFRSGLDAVMLAAAVPAKAKDTVLELGAGAGVASLCLAARVPGCTIVGLEIDPELVALANGNTARNGLESRVRFLPGDVCDPPRGVRTGFDHVFANPPFHDPRSDASPVAERARAKRDAGQLATWLAMGLKRTASNGTFTLILRADRLGEALAALPATGVTVFPLWPKADRPAKRILIQTRKSARAPLAVLPGLVLHRRDGGYTPGADAVLHGAPLSLVPPRPRL